MHPTAHRRTVRTALALVPLGLVALPLSAAFAEGAGPAIERAAVVQLPHGDVPRALPTAPGEDVQHLVVGDMVVTLVGDARTELPTGATPTAGAPGAGAPGADADHDEDAPGPHEAADGDAAGGFEAASGGYSPFSATARLLRTGYVIRLAGGDGRIEQYRPELVAAARAASAASGVPVRVAAGTGGPVQPGRGEIVAVVGAGPCGAGVAGCGGPVLSTTEVVSGRVWIDPSALGLAPSMRANLAAHELGHALGLRHHEADWTDGRQVMHPRLHGATTYRAGDSAGLRWLAGAQDRAAGTFRALAYAAGQLHVEGTLDGGTRVRVTSGTAGADLAGRGGRYAGALALPAGTHRVCARVLDAPAGFRPDLGCADVVAAGTPFGRLDGATDKLSTIRITGWAADPQTAAPVQVEVRRDGALVGRATADRARTDLGGNAARYGDRHGFDVEVPAVPGRNRLCVLVVGVGGGGNLDLGCQSVDHTVVPATVPVPAPGAGGPAADPVAPVVDVVAGLPAAVIAPVGRLATPPAGLPLLGSGTRTAGR